jgi:hypothetical protein
MQLLPVGEHLLLPSTAAISKLDVVLIKQLLDL